MSEQLIPAEVRDFLLGRIDSIAQLEALLLLCRESDKRWDAAAVARRLYIDEVQAAQLLSRLAQDGLLARERGAYWYAPETPELARLVELVTSHYARHLIPVTNLIHGKPSRIQQFADAFKLKKGG